MVVVAVILFFIYALSDAAVSFNTQDFACVRGVEFLTSCTRTSELRRPLFDTSCGANYSQDHAFELQIAKAFLNEDNKTSLSCKTIRWLNSVGNVRCVPTTLNAEKGMFFKALMEKVRVERCTQAEKWSLRRQVQCFLTNGAVQCGNSAFCSSRSLYVSKSCCCNEMSVQNSAFLPSIGSIYSTEELAEDFSELNRFLEYKIKLFCAGVGNVTSLAKAKAPPVELQPRISS